MGRGLHQMKALAEMLREHQSYRFIKLRWQFYIPFLALTVVSLIFIPAIRLDRTRGGRSSYEGCSPHGRPKAAPSVEKKVPRIRPVKKTSGLNPELVLPKNLQNVQMTLPTGEEVSSSQLMAILNRSGRLGSQSDAPFVPEVLTEIMNLESLLCDDDGGNELPTEKLSDMDPNMFGSLLQLAEIKLYKLVRWARNLPQFSAIAVGIDS